MRSPSADPLELCAGEHTPGRVARRVEHDEPRPRRDERGQQVGVEAEPIALALLVRFWRIVLTTFALLMIIAALILFSVILDVHVVQGVTTYLRNLVHLITG